MTGHLHFSWIELSVFVPLVGAAVVWRLEDRVRARLISTIICALTLGLTLGEWIDFGTLGGYEASDPWGVTQRVFSRDLLVIDELSAPLLPLAALLYLATVMTTLRTKIGRFSFGWTLFSESILLATLSCRQPWIIILLLAIATLPPAMELKRRNQNRRIYIFHMGLFLGLLCVGQLLAGNNPSVTNPPIIAGCLLTAGALIRSGICPLHCWIPDLFEKATFGTALLYVTPMTGAYAVMRLVFPIAPSWALQSIALLSLVTAVYASGMALVQRDSRRFYCYLFLSHSSLVLVGLEVGTAVGLAGALCIWLSVGISLLGFGLALRSVEARTGRLTLDSFHGLYEHLPFLSGMFLLTGLASIGFPGTIGFVATELLVKGAVEVYPFVGLAIVVAAALNGIAIVKAYFLVFTGTRHIPSFSMGCRPAERLTILVIVVLIIGGGLFPQPGVASRYHAARALLDRRSRKPVTSVESVPEEQADSQFHPGIAANR